MIGRIGSPTMNDHCGSAHCGPFKVRAWANIALVKDRFSRRSGRMLRSARVKRIGSPSTGMTTKPTACGAAASVPSAKLFHCSRSSKSMSPLATASLM